MSIVQGGIVSQGSIQRELQAGINSIIDDFRSYPTEYSQIYSVESSKKAYEDFVVRSGTYLLQVKPEGQAIQYDSYSEVGLKQLVHINYGLGVSITQEAIDDNLYLDEMVKAGKWLGKSELKTKETVAAALFDQGYNSSYFTTWDQQALFSSAHVVGKGGATQSNMLSTPSALNQASLESAVIAISGFLDTAGLLAKVMPKKLIIPRSDVFIAERITKSFLQSDNANNNINAIQSLGVLPEGYMVAHYLNNQTNWFIKTDEDEYLKFLERSSYSGADNDFNTSDYRHKVTNRFVVGAVDWRCVFGSGNAGS